MEMYIEFGSDEYRARAAELALQSIEESARFAGSKKGYHGKDFSVEFHTEGEKEYTYMVLKDGHWVELSKEEMVKCLSPILTTAILESYRSMIIDEHE